VVATNDGVASDQLMPAEFSVAGLSCSSISQNATIILWRCWSQQTQSLDAAQDQGKKCSGRRRLRQLEHQAPDVAHDLAADFDRIRVMNPSAVMPAMVTGVTANICQAWCGCQ